MEHRQIDTLHPAYIEAHSGFNLFISQGWLSLFDEQAKLYGVFKGEELLAVHHTYEYRRTGKSFLIATPMAPHCGLQLLRQHDTPYMAQSDHKRILRVVAAFLAEKARHSYVDMALPTSISDVQPFVWEGLKATPGYTYMLNLSLKPEVLLAAMSSNRRRNLQDASHGGYEVIINGNHEAVLALVGNTLKRAGETSRHEWLSKLLAPSNDGWCFTVIVSKDGVPAATTVIGYMNHTAYYLAGGHLQGDNLAGSLSLWSAINECQLRGLKLFDFLGSSVPGIEQYFRSFGGTLTPWFRIGGGQGVIPFLKTLKKRLSK